MKKNLVVFYLLCTSSMAAMAQNTKPTVNDEPGISYFPNYHPLVVHFPLVLLIVAAAMQVGLMFFQGKLYNYTIVALTVVGFVAGMLATTVFHAHPAHDVNAKAMEIFKEHKEFAYITIWLSGIAAVFKLLGLFVKRKWVEIIALLFLLGSAVTVSIAGHHGAELVFKQGIGPEDKKLEHGDD